MDLVNLAIDPKKREENMAALDAPAEPSQPKYPYGTSLYLDDGTLEALGMKEMPPTGTVFKLLGVAKVVGTSEREFETAKGVEKRRTLDIQITDMGLDGGKKQTFKEAAGTLYPAKK